MVLFVANAMDALLDTIVWYHIIFVDIDYYLANDFMCFKIIVNGQYGANSFSPQKHGFVLFPIMACLYSSCMFSFVCEHGLKATGWLLSFS